jgi:opacity protein-like surface antigen
MLCILSVTGIRTVAAQTADQVPRPKKFTPEVDMSLGLYGQQTVTRMPTSTTVYSTGTRYTQVTQGTAPSAGLLATFHQSFSPWLGYNVNFGFTRLTEHYSNAFEGTSKSGATLPSASGFIRGAVRANMYEVTVASVIEGPRTRRFSTFAQFGGGGLFFTPLSSGLGATQETRPAMLFGAGANYKLTPRLDLRAEYRGLLYKSPDFGIPDIYPGITSPDQFPMTRLFTVTSTPTVSLVYRFGRTGSQKTAAKKP